MKWSNIDWNKRSSIIAKELGICITQVSRNRRKYSPSTVKNKNPVTNWAKVDWSKSTNTLAKQYKVTPSTVSNQRRRRAPETIHKIPDCSKVNWNLPLFQIANMLGLSISRVCILRKQHNTNL